MAPKKATEQQSPSSDTTEQSENNLSSTKEPQSSKDEDFEKIDHPDTERKPSADSHDDLSLQRFINSSTMLENVHDDEDDSDDDDEQAMASHPIFGMLAGRLGQQRRRGSTHRYDQYHPENQILTVANVDDCVEVEKAFPEHERCSREKFEYRLTLCPELSLGLFTQPTAAEVEEGSTEKRKLIAHIIATRTAAPCVTDASMELPKDWKTAKPNTSTSASKDVIGHEEVGGTVCIHSLAVSPEYQNLGLGSVLLRCYIQRIKDAKIADRLALLAHEELKRYYGRFGFDDMGESNCKFGGGGWSNMILEFSDLSDD